MFLRKYDDLDCQEQRKNILVFDTLNLQKLGLCGNRLTCRFQIDRKRWCVMIMVIGIYLSA